MKFRVFGLGKSYIVVSPENMSSMEDENFKILSTRQYSDRYAWKAFDNNLSTWHDGRGNTPRILGYQRKDGKKNSVLSYHIYGIASGSHGDNAGHWALQGSNDGVNWDDLHVVGNDSVYTAWEGEKWHDFYLNGESGYYQYIRWCIYKNAQGGSPEYNPYIKAFKVMGRLK